MHALRMFRAFNCGFGLCVGERLLVEGRVDKTGQRPPTVRLPIFKDKQINTYMYIHTCNTYVYVHICMYIYIYIYGPNNSTTILRQF